MEVKCRKSKTQEYQCSVMVKAPWKSSKNFISFDACLAKELFFLWDKGIETTGCCCGKHYKRKNDIPYISVFPKYVDKMIKLGYNSINKEKKDHFILKTKL